MKNWEKVCNEILVNKSTMEIMCSIELIEGLANIPKFVSSVNLFTKNLLTLLVHHYLNLLYYRSRWNQTHENIYNTQTILIVENLEEKLLREKNGEQCPIFVLSNQELIKGIYNILDIWDAMDDSMDEEYL